MGNKLWKVNAGVCTSMLINTPKKKNKTGSDLMRMKKQHILLLDITVH